MKIISLKAILILISLSLLSEMIRAQSYSSIISRQAKRELDPPYNIYHEIEAAYFNEGLQLDDRKDFLDQLRVAKSLLIDGHSNDAILVLEKLLAKTNSYKKELLIKRFLVLAYFSDARAKETRDTLASLQDNASWFYQNCTLRMVSALSMPKEMDSKVEEIYNNCIIRVHNKNPYQDNTWLNLVLEKRLKGYVRSTQIRDLMASNNLDIIKTVLRYGIFFKEHERVLKHYGKIPVDFYADPMLRTLVAVNLYNAGKYDQALKLAQSIDNTNTNKIKGHMEVHKGDIKTAYSHYISNLILKPESIVNNKLLLAAAWLSGNFRNARVALSKIPVSDSLSREKELLRINILIKEGKFKEAVYLMNNLDIRYNKRLPYEAAILSTYLKLLNNDQNWVQLSDKSCLNKNIISCWLHMQSKLWNNFTTEVIRKDQKMESKTIQDRLEAMIAPVSDKKFEEPVLIYQKDIYELDLAQYPKLGH
ncbi:MULTISPECIES: hypothetical protein [Pseudomonadati]|uniref:hypothetical protein n=1 Tax=unclassified Halobacteriovorax TaxID=2639665 RepID=UPI000CD115A2|nr:hypothetical protein [Halobacteriovorax sp. DA5]POB14519.1 hypothetical protein C0Z22_05345 [Halobacteriovorax sp. DA5]